MRDALLAYFTGEKQGGYWFFGAGVIALSVCAILYKSAAWYRAILYPLAIIGIIQFAAGVVLFVRTDAQVAALEARLASAPAEYKATEAKRVKGVMLGFKVFETCWLLMIAAGAYLAFRGDPQSKSLAIGIGLILQGAAMMGLDLFAEARGAVYLKALEGFGP